MVKEKEEGINENGQRIIYSIYNRKVTTQVERENDNFILKMNKTGNDSKKKKVTNWRIKHVERNIRKRQRKAETTRK